MNYEDKQGWIEAVMADKCLTPATARYAFGIFKHMFGKKDESFPGAKALSEATGLNDGHFYKYNEALVEAGYLQVTSTRGRSNTYKLLLPTSTGGNHLPPQAVGVPRAEVTPTSTGGTNTTRKTTSKTSKESYKTTVVADAPTVQHPNSVVRESGKENDTPLNLENTEAGIECTNEEADNAPTASGGRYDPTETFNTRSKELQRQKELAASIPEEW